MHRAILIIIVLAAAIGVSSCMFGTNTTNVRGQVMFEGKPVANTEIRMSGGGKEVIGETNYDGRYTLTLEHPRTEHIEVKVIKVGFVHDPIDFPGQTSTSKVVDIQLKRVFVPGAPASPSPSPLR